MKRIVSLVLIAALFLNQLCMFSPPATAATLEGIQSPSGNVKKLSKDGKVAITLKKNAGTKAGKIVHVSRGKQFIGTLKVLKAGPGWCVAKILSVEKGEKIFLGDSVSVTKPEAAKTPTQPEVIKKPKITKTPVIEETTKEPEKKAEEVVTVPTQKEETTKEEEKKPEEKKQTIDDILKELRGEKTESETETITFTRKNKLAVMGFENLSKNTDGTLTGKALNSMTEALLKTERFTLVERDKIGVALFELKLQETEFFKPESARKVGEFLKAELIAVGSIKSVSFIGKAQKGALVELSLRIFETETGKLLYLLSSVGKSEGEGSSDYHVGQAMNRASMFIAHKLPGEVQEFSAAAGMAEVNLGAENGIKKDQELGVYREGKEIGKIVAKTVRQRSLAGLFIASKAGAVLREGDQVFNSSIKDDTPPKKSKGGISTTTMLLGVLALGALVGLAGGGGGGGGNGGTGSDTTSSVVTTTPQPPGPPGQ